MRLRSLAVQDFRNLAEVALAPSPRATVLLGENGQGKTNLLEAVYFLTTLKPLRAARLAELVSESRAAAPQAEGQAAEPAEGPSAPASGSEPATGPGAGGTDRGSGLAGGGGTPPNPL